ncbi:MAG: S8 family serine peptidase, partial [Bacteroidia bacterium]|nr:S8 family serine peptidase [Bacteroidia bacterium]
MKRISRIAVLMTCFCASPAWCQQSLTNENYWYHGNIKRPLIADFDRVFVGIPENATDEAIRRVVARHRLPLRPYDPQNRKKSPNSVVLYTQNVVSARQYVRIVETLRNDPFFVFASPCFQGPMGEWKTYADEIVVKTFVSETELRELVQKHGAKIVKADPYMPGVWLLKTADPKSDKTPVVVANALYETGKFVYAEPNFLRQIRPLTNDPYFNQQWALKNLGPSSVPQGGSTPDADLDVEEAWTITTGSPNIKVAILDEGVDFNHPDLPNVLPGFDPGGNSINGEPVDPFVDVHGTPCAGIVGAQTDNNLGVAGIAPQCRIVPVYLIGSMSMTDDYEIAAAFNWCRTQ